MSTNLLVCVCLLLEELGSGLEDGNEYDTEAK